MINTLELLECGHPESPHSEITRGYGRDEQGNRYCYACCAESDKKYMREHGKITLYFDGSKVTNWPDSLEFMAKNIRKSWHNIGRVRYDFRFMFEGEVWSGYQIGEWNQIAHCKRTKRTSVYG